MACSHDMINGCSGTSIYIKNERVAPCQLNKLLSIIMKLQHITANNTLEQYIIRVIDTFEN